MSAPAPDPSHAPDGRPAEREPLWRDVLGEQLRALRQERSETLRAIAGRANLSTQYLSEIERGRKEPSSEVVAALAGALGLTLLDLTVGTVDRLRDGRASERGAFRLAA